MRQYSFVSQIRFWSMFAIISIHSLYQRYPVGETPQVLVWQGAAAQLFKFGSIAFFVISGFLLAERLDHRHPWRYFCRRARVLGGPWCFWSGLSITGLLAIDWLGGRGDASLVKELESRATQIAFGSIYWFIPNLLFALALLILFHRVCHRWWFGIILCLLSAAYGLNVYTGWVRSDHKIALFGFIFYLWLGGHLGRNLPCLLHWIRKTPWVVLLLANAVLFALSMEESAYLAVHSHGDPTNTLRISNQLYSLSVLLTLLKLPAWSPSFLNVRRETFGLYLIHPILLKSSQPLIAYLGTTISRYSHLDIWHTSLVAPAVWTMTFIILYGGSLAITKGLNKTVLSVVIGQKPFCPVRQTVPVPVLEFVPHGLRWTSEPGASDLARSVAARD